MPRRLPSVVGVHRKKKTTRIHEEVERSLQDIADLEDKSFNWVVSEIIYMFFGLEIDDDIIKIRRTRRKTKARARSHRPNRADDRRVAVADVLRFEKRRDGKRSA